MISHERFNKLEPYNILLFKNGRLRIVADVSHCYGKRTRKKPRTLLKFVKVIGSGFTYYLWNDIKHDIIGVYKKKYL